MHMKPYLRKASANQGEHCTWMEISPHKGVNTKRSASGICQGLCEEGMKYHDGKVGCRKQEYAIAKRARIKLRATEATSRRHKRAVNPAGFHWWGEVEENIQGGTLDVLEDVEGRGRC